MMQGHPVSLSLALLGLDPGTSVWIFQRETGFATALGTGKGPSASGSFPAPGPSLHPSPGANRAPQHLQLLLPSGLAWKEDLQEDTGRSERSQLLKLGKWGKKRAEGFPKLARIPRPPVREQGWFSRLK